MIAFHLLCYDRRTHVRERERPTTVRISGNTKKTAKKESPIPYNISARYSTSRKHLLRARPFIPGQLPEQLPRHTQHSSAQQGSPRPFLSDLLPSAERQVFLTMKKPGARWLGLLVGLLVASTSVQAQEHPLSNPSRHSSGVATTSTSAPRTTTTVLETVTCSPRTVSYCPPPMTLCGTIGRSSSPSPNNARNSR